MWWIGAAILLSIISMGLGGASTEVVHTVLFLYLLLVLLTGFSIVIKVLKEILLELCVHNRIKKDPSDDQKKSG